MAAKWIEDIRERLDKTTEGEWEAVQIGSSKHYGDVRASIMPIFPQANRSFAIASVLGPDGIKNAKFLAKAHQDIPRLLLEIDRLNGLVGEMKEAGELMANEIYQSEECEAVPDVNPAQNWRNILALLTRLEGE